MKDGPTWRGPLVPLLVVAGVVRLVQIVVESAYLHPDALFQTLEPAFSSVWGHGIETWEQRENLRSWTWPGLLAVAMAAAKGLGLAGPGIGMGPAIALVRTVVIAIDLAMVACAYRLAHTFGGTTAALAAGVALAVHPAFVVMGAQPLVDVPATALLVLALERGLGASSITRGRALVLGLALVATVAVRIQLAPAIAVLVVMLIVRIRRGRLGWGDGATAGLVLGLAIACPAQAMVDMVTAGAPFAPTVAYVRYNLGEGLTAFGTMPGTRYATDAWRAMGLLAVVVAILSAWGLGRAWPIAVVFLSVVVPHQAIPYKVWRFVHPALPLLVVVAAVGLSSLSERLSARSRRGLWVASLMVVAVELGWAAVREAPWETTWLYAQGGRPAVERSRALNEAFLQVSAGPAPRRIAQAVLPAAASPGYALLGHDVPVHPVLDSPLDAAIAAEVDVWIVPIRDGAVVPSGFEISWRDPVSQVAILRQRRS